MGRDSGKLGGTHWWCSSSSIFQMQGKPTRQQASASVKGYFDLILFEDPY